MQVWGLTWADWGLVANAVKWLSINCWHQEIMFFRLGTASASGLLPSDLSAVKSINILWRSMTSLLYWADFHHCMSSLFYKLHVGTNHLLTCWKHSWPQTQLLYLNYTAMLPSAHEMSFKRIRLQCNFLPYAREINGKCAQQMPVVLWYGVLFAIREFDQQYKLDCQKVKKDEFIHLRDIHDGQIDTCVASQALQEIDCQSDCLNRSNFL